MLAIIGGTGFASLPEFQLEDAVKVDTPWGDAQLQRGELAGKPVVFIPRHGNPPRIPPHRINYRANIQALVSESVTEVIAINAVGSVCHSLKVSELVLVDQVIDYTWGRAGTFYDEAIHHIDFTCPFDRDLRHNLISAAQGLTGDALPSFRHTGVYGCTQGPRLETAAEIQRMARDGCDVVGMTAMPEAALAREKNLAYAAICMVVNKGAGLEGDAITMEAISSALALSVGYTMNWINRYLSR